METSGKRIGFLHAVRRLLLAAACGVLLEVITVLIFALIAVKSGSLHAVINACVYMGSMIGGICSGWIAARKAGKNGLLNGAGAALICALLTGLLAMIPDGSLQTGRLVLPVVCVTGGLVGGLIGVNFLHAI